MRRHGGTAILLGALTLGSLTGCATADAEPPSIPAGQAQRDARITADVKAALGQDPGLRSAGIDVETSAGIVRLSGFVGSAEDVAAAAAVARTVKGVASIRNELRLK